jgi:F-type H+-transporting ATPase subunit delta
LENPLLKAEDKKAVLSRILGRDINPLFHNFLMLLVDRRRIIFLEEIAQKYLEILRKLNNTVLAFVTSATKMSEGQKHAVADKVHQLTGAQSVELKTSVDPDLIGGVIIKVGSQVFDASLRGQLRRIRLNLMGTA